MGWFVEEKVPNTFCLPRFISLALCLSHPDPHFSPEGPEKREEITSRCFLHTENPHLLKPLWMAAVPMSNPRDFGGIAQDRKV